MAWWAAKHNTTLAVAKHEVQHLDGLLGQQWRNADDQ